MNIIRSSRFENNSAITAFGSTKSADYNGLQMPITWAGGVMIEGKNIDWIPVLPVKWVTWAAILFSFVLGGSTAAKIAIENVFFLYIPKVFHHLDAKVIDSKCNCNAFGEKTMLWYNNCLLKPGRIWKYRTCSWMRLATCNIVLFCIERNAVCGAIFLEALSPPL